MKALGAHGDPYRAPPDSHIFDNIHSILKRNTSKGFLFNSPLNCIQTFVQHFAKIFSRKALESPF